MTPARLLLVCLMAATALAGPAAAQNCPAQSAVLTGHTSTDFGLGPMVFTERVTLQRQRGGSDLAGVWEMSRYEQIYDYPTPGMGAFSMPTERVAFGDGTYMDCVADVQGARVHMDCPEGNVRVRLDGGAVRWATNDIAFGSYSGRTITLTFPTGSPMQPTVSGDVVEGGGAQHVSLSIAVTSGVDGQHVFDADADEVTVSARAEVEPASLAEAVTWTFPEFDEHVTRMPEGELRGREVSVTYNGLPARNDLFGRRTITARVNAGGGDCDATASAEATFFFARGATNNPSGERPNWLYYWAQTACGRPYGARPGFQYRTDYPDCASNNTLGSVSYDPEWALHNEIYVCDIPAILGAEMRETLPRLRRATDVDGETVFHFDGNYTTTGIDTFGAFVMHEYNHVQNFQRWWRGSASHYQSVWRQQDADYDTIPDRLEAEMGFDPGFQFTPYQLTSDPALTGLRRRLVYDEHWLVFERTADFTPGSCDAEDWAAPGRNWRQ